MKPRSAGQPRRGIFLTAMPTVDESLQTQLRNIERDYGQSIDELTSVVGKSGLTKHTEIVAMLKQRYAMTHGAAHRVSIVARDRLGAGSPPGAKPAVGVETVYEQ